MATKKLTQTTLSFLIKPKPLSDGSCKPTAKIQNEKSPAGKGKLSAPTRPSTGKKRQSNAESQEHPSKKTRLSLKTKHDCDTDSVEPEVTSSSEVPIPEVSQLPKAVGDLTPYLRLSRCDSPKIEVTSSTEDGITGLSPSLSPALSPTPSPTSRPPAKSAPETPALTHASEVEKETNSGVVLESICVDDGDVVIVERPTDNSETVDADASSLNDSKNDGLSTSSIDDLNRSDSTTRNRKTPKLLSASAVKRKEEKERIQEEKREQRRLKEQQKQEEKVKKEREAAELKRQREEKKEQERLAKQREKEEKQRLKEEQQAKKQAEIDARNALKENERKKKEEEKLRKEEEKNQKEKEKLQKEEEKLKKENAQKNAFIKFFSPVAKKQSLESTVQVSGSSNSSSRFKPFPVKSDMQLAPVSRRDSVDVTFLDKSLTSQAPPKVAYLSEVKKSGGRTCPDTWPWLDDDVMVAGTTRHRAKLLQFHTDIRPAYFGTWRRQSRHVRPRRPLGQDKELFDYDEDSADEWEEEEPGESVDSGDDEDEEKDEFDFDPELKEDGFLVDHNYLSDGEGGVSDDEESLAAKKTKQMIARTYGKRNRRKSKLKPTVYGTVWTNEEDVEEERSAQASILSQWMAIMFTTVPVSFDAPTQISPKLTDSVPTSKRNLQRFPEAAMPDLIRTIHGCMRAWTDICRRFQQLWSSKSDSGDMPSKKLTKSVISSIARYTRKPEFGRVCWYVNDDILSKYQLTGLPVPNPVHDTPTTITNERASISAATAVGAPMACHVSVGSAALSSPVVPARSPAPTGISSSAEPALVLTTADAKAVPETTGQKRLTDFLMAPPSKRLREMESGEERRPPPRKIQLVTLSDSPTNQPSPANKNNPANTQPLNKYTNPTTDGQTGTSGPRRVSTQLVYNPVKSTPLSNTDKPMKAQSTSETVKTSVQTPSSAALQNSGSTTSPRRVSFTTLSASQATSPVTTTASTPKTTLPPPGNSPSPRRVSFTTLSAPKESRQPRRIILSSLTQQAENAPSSGQTNERVSKPTPTLE